MIQPVKALALTAALTLSYGAQAEVPIPRLAPQPGVTHATLGGASHILAEETLPLSTQIKKEATVDVSIAVSAFYKERDYAPIWTAQKAAALRERLARAGDDGFDPAHYRVADVGEGGLTEAAVEVSLTEAALRYAHHATSGRTKPRSISSIMTIEPPTLDERQFLNRLAATNHVKALLDSLHPTHPAFVGLREALKAARGVGPDQRVAVPSGRNLRLGSKGPRVAALRSRLDETVPRGTDPTRFDKALDTAVRDFQRAQKVRADGIVGPQTLRLLNDGLGEDDVAALISNMERWRWLPRNLGKHHVFVNIPAYRVRVVSSGSVTYDGRVIVGKPGNPTPIFSDEIEHLVVNPYWNVPYSIASKEMLGGIQANPGGYFRRRGYEAVYRGRVVDPASLSWNRGMLRNVRIRQRPGRRNALGAVKFMFPNKHAVYLHDTPTKHLFKRDRRAYSHGCVRVDQPFVFAEALLALDEGVSGSGIKRMVGGRQRHVNLEAHIPVHLTYFTRETKDDGTVKKYADVYGYDRRTQRALGL
ncbi:MAG: L,D-transpeptidase family protein [Pseudomonadota bacterium]